MNPPPPPRRLVFAGEDLAAELVRCLDFSYFLFNHVYIADRTPGAVAGRIQWEHWPVHDEMIADLASEPRYILLKARQMGASWFWAAVHAHGMLFTANYLGGVISAGQTESAEFLAKVRAILENLPWATLPSFETDNSEVLRLAATAGAVMAFPSTQKAGRGFTFTRMVVDEAAFHGYAAENYAAYEPATEFGQIAIMSSAGDDERQVVNDWFQTMWTSADLHLSDFCARFYGRYVRPGRDGDWEARTRRRYINNPQQFEREYPATPTDAFRSMLSLRFDAQAVDRAKGQCAPALPAGSYRLPDGVDPRYVAIWCLPRAGVPYVAYTDGAEAKGRDFTVTLILEAKTLRHVATLRENLVEPTQHGVMAERLCRWYNTAYWGVERNRGEAILYTVGQTHYPRVYWHDERVTQRKVWDGTEPTRRLGFPVTVQTRSALIDDLAEAIVTGGLTSPDALFWAEAGTFILNPAGRPEAAPGRHDDTVLAMAGAVRMARQPGAQTLVGTGTPVERPDWNF